MDGSLVLKYDIHDFANNKTEGIWMGRHPMRQCAYKELEVIKNKRIDDPGKIDAQVARYKEDNFPENYGLWRGCRILRNKGVEILNEKWWEEVSRGTWRDQPGLPYSSWKIGTKIQTVLGGVMNTFFKMYLHTPRVTSNTIIRPKGKISAEEYKNAWVQIGEFTSANEAIAKHPLVHSIVDKKSGGFVFQGWLYDYLPYMDKFIEHIKVYDGTLIYWGE